MTTILVRSGNGPRFDAVTRYLECRELNMAIMPDVTPDVTAEDIHHFIVTREEAMDHDVAYIVDRFQRGISSHGYNVDFAEEVSDLNLLNATWSRTWVQDDYTAMMTFSDRPNDRKTMTAQITSKDLHTWLGTCQDPFSYLAVHLDVVNMHNDEVERVGKRAADIATARQWCAEFDEIMQDIRTDLSRSRVTNAQRFAVRDSEYEVIVRVGISVPWTGRARNFEHLEQIISEQLTVERVRTDLVNTGFDIVEIEAR
jgi:hypothetical protein